MKLSSAIYATVMTTTLSGCSTIWNWTWIWTWKVQTPEYANISPISPQEMSQYWWIMTRSIIINGKEKIEWICHFSKVRIPSDKKLQEEYKTKTWKDWHNTGWDTYTVTARHCIDTSMWDVRSDRRIDVVAIRSLNRLENPSGVVFRSIDKPPVLERSSYDEANIDSRSLVLRACIPHISKNASYCFKLEWKTYSEWAFWQRYFFYRIADILPFIKQAWRTCKNDPTVSWTSGMIVTENSKAFGVVSNGTDICKAITQWKTFGLLGVEVLRNTVNSWLGAQWKTLIIPN